MYLSQRRAKSFPNLQKRPWRVFAKAMLRISRQLCPQDPNTSRLHIDESRDSRLAGETHFVEMTDGSNSKGNTKKV